MRSVSISGARVVARRPAQSDVLVVLAGRDERRHVEPVLGFYRDQGVDVAYVDDGSSDGTLDIVLDHLGDPVVWAGSKPFTGVFDLSLQLRIKEDLMASAPHEWVVHADMDEYRRPFDADLPLAEALRFVGAEGANAVNFQEFTFLPVLEASDHDHPAYRTTMVWYYPFLPHPRHHLNAFMPSRLPGFDLVSKAGHQLVADGMRVHDQDFALEHYPFLSLPHFREQYVDRKFSLEDLERGWHHNRTNLVEPVLCAAGQLTDRNAVGLVADDVCATHRWVVQTKSGS